MHEHHSNNPRVDLIAFDHRLYALGKNAEGDIALYRITGEEMYEGAKATNNKRFHNLKYVEQIKEIGAAEGLTTGENIPGAATLSSQTPISNYTVADLYSFVKQYDADFNLVNIPDHPRYTLQDMTEEIIATGAKEGDITWEGILSLTEPPLQRLSPEFREAKSPWQPEGKVLDQIADYPGYGRCRHILWRDAAGNPRYQTYVNAKTGKIMHYQQL